MAIKASYDFFLSKFHSKIFLEHMAHTRKESFHLNLIWFYFIKTGRNEAALTTKHRVEFIKVEYPSFIGEYSIGKVNPHESLLRLVGQVAYRNGMRHCKVSDAKMHSNRLKNTRNEFSISFMQTYARF